MIGYIGDISRRDAEVLKHCAEVSTNILEFGCGASTQVLAAYTKGRIISIDTKPMWIDKTKLNLKKLGIANEPEFVPYKWFIKAFSEGNPEFDFIFIDGRNKLRLFFAKFSWKLLKVGGIIAFHDTRRSKDVANMLTFLKSRFNEVDKIFFNQWDSNITTIRKKRYQPYENWNEIENREPWQIGY